MIFLFDSALLSFIHSADSRVQWQAFFEVYLPILEPCQKTPWTRSTGEEINDINRKNKDRDMWTTREEEQGRHEHLKLQEKGSIGKEEE